MEIDTIFLVRSCVVKVAVLSAKATDIPLATIRILAHGDSLDKLTDTCISMVGAATITEGMCLDHASQVTSGSLRGGQIGLVTF